MNTNIELTFPALFKQSATKNPDNIALSFVGEKSLSYLEVEKHIDAVISFLEKLGVQPEDKIAILSANMPNWGITYLAITFMGAVAVPMLPDFTPLEVENVLDHSESRVLFVSASLAPKLTDIKTDGLNHIVGIDDFSLVGPDKTTVEFDMSLSPLNKYRVREDDLAVLIYTSGTTGNSKGVMLSHKNIAVNAIQGGKIHPLDKTDRLLSILPLSHTLENTLGLILPLISGSSVYYLRKPPTPTVLLPALKEIKPTTMLTVPLIIEKIYRKKIRPTFNKSFIIRTLYKAPFIRKQLNRIAGKKLMKTFGGCLTFYGIGGAKLNRVVEKFLIEAKFPYAIGYGLTETAPLLAGVSPKQTRLESTGPAVEGVELKINNPDPVTGEGEIWARGPNVMKGYYKEPEKTREVITEEGWFKTGDLGVMDKDNFLFIKGRLKNVILGASGENIYPEEIESVINSFRHVVESLVVEKKGKLVALVHFNHEEITEKYLHLREELANYVENKVEDLMKELQIYINSRVNKFSRVKLVVSQRDPFMKTATHKIKRYLYV